MACAEHRGQAGVMRGVVPRKHTGRLLCASVGEAGARARIGRPRQLRQKAEVRPGVARRGSRSPSAARVYCLPHASMDAPLVLRRRGHFQHCRQCLTGLPGREVGLDYARVSVVFYCLGGLDVLDELGGVLEEKKAEWRAGLWNMQTGAARAGARCDAMAR
jgi:hypothetical protein